jgi:flagellar biosynthesis protein FlhA
VSGGIGFWVQRLRKDESLDQIAKEQTATTQSSVEEQDVQWEDVSQVDLISLEIGYGLIPLVNTETGGQLLSRVKGVRKKLSTELGFLIQPVRIRDNLDLEPNTYHLLVNGVLRGRGQSYSGKELAINPGHITTPIDGIAT